MVLYEPLPTELWFIIYKIEHQMKLEHVNHSIIALSNDEQGWSWHRYVLPVYSIGKNGLVYNFTCCNWENGFIEDIKQMEKFWIDNEFIWVAP